MQKMSPKTGGNGHCTHHWLIEEADGEFSAGVCKYCGETKMFSNWLPMLYFVSADEVRKEEKVSWVKRQGVASYNPASVAYELGGMGQ